jgi:hypothetical protein
VVDGFAAPELLHYLWYLVRTVGGDQDVYRLSDDLFRGVAVDLLCTSVPVGDDCLKRFADYGIV